MRSGANLAMQAAPVVLMTPSLERVTEVFEIPIGAADRGADLFWAFVHNAAGVTPAVAGVFNPTLAAAMVLSSLPVIGNSSRLARRRQTRNKPGE